MRKIIGIGETILDIIFKNDRPTGATPGGSVFNGLITLGRLKEAQPCPDYEVLFISDIGNDRVGSLIAGFMEKNGVSSRGVNRHPTAKTAVSLAFLDENNDADYTFFKDYSFEGLQGDFPEIHRDDIVIFGSYYALNPLLRKRMKVFLQQAHEVGALIYYDVNFRKSHTYEAGYLEPTLEENFRYADILRGSEDDFEALYGTGRESDKIASSEKVYDRHIAPFCRFFVFTSGAGEVVLHTPKGRFSYRVSPIEPLSTVGAGDNFNAGILYGLARKGVGKDRLDELKKKDWDDIIAYALEFSKRACLSYDNYISSEDALEIVRHQR